MPSLLWFATVYLAVGIVLAVIGPLQRKRQVEVLIAAARNPSISSWKLACFNLAIVVGTILLWPLFLLSVVPRKVGDVAVVKEKGLRFEYLGGAGKILCLQCGYFNNIVSFEHGSHSEPWCKTGYQCQRCGDFVALENVTSERCLAGCKCGGNLSREHLLFCPACKSRNLDYRMEYIT